MLKYRIFTALLLIPVVMGLLFFAPAPLFLVAAWGLILGCAYEWTKLIPTQNQSQVFVFMLILLISIPISLTYQPLYISAAFLLWIGIVYALFTFPDTQSQWGHPYVVAFSGFILLPLAGAALTRIYLMSSGQALLLYFLLLVWLTDTGAYFIGKFAGKHKLIPFVSPGKTVEGAIGGIASALLISLFAYFYFSPHSKTLWFIQAACAILFSMIGDLLISMLKRRVKCKDTSQILPGHGGLLDRLDSLIAAAPVFYLLGQ